MNLACLILGHSLTGRSYSLEGRRVIDCQRCCAPIVEPIVVPDVVPVLSQADLDGGVPVTAGPVVRGAAVSHNEIAERARKRLERVRHNGS